MIILLVCNSPLMFVVIKIKVLIIMSNNLVVITKVESSDTDSDDGCVNSDLCGYDVYIKLHRIPLPLDMANTPPGTNLTDWFIDKMFDSTLSKGTTYPCGSDKCTLSPLAEENGLTPHTYKCTVLMAIVTNVEPL